MRHELQVLIQQMCIRLRQSSPMMRWLRCAVWRLSLSKFCYASSGLQIAATELYHLLSPFACSETPHTCTLSKVLVSDDLTALQG